MLNKFEKKRKNSNYIFATGIDFLHEFFKLTNKYNIKSIDNIFKFLNQNSFIKKKIEKIADRGLAI